MLFSTPDASSPSTDVTRSLPKPVEASSPCGCVSKRVLSSRRVASNEWMDGWRGGIRWVQGPWLEVTHSPYRAHTLASMPLHSRMRKGKAGFWTLRSL